MCKWVESHSGKPKFTHLLSGSKKRAAPGEGDKKSRDATYYSLNKERIKAVQKARKLALKLKQENQHGNK